jgi:hypothetical protein
VNRSRGTRIHNPIPPVSVPVLEPDLRHDVRMTADAPLWNWPPGDADEVTVLIGFLERQRAIFDWKTSDVDAAGMRRMVGSSAITLGGLLKHLAHAEAHWFSTYLTGEEPGAPWDTSESWGNDWDCAVSETPAQLRKLWQDSVTQARSRTAEVVGAGGLGTSSRPPWDEGLGRPSVRWIVCHMIEEYARHLGHADLIREAVDGAVGEDPGES